MILIALSLAAAPLCIETVHDGDSVRLCSGERVRLDDIDAPEVFGSPRCSRASVRRLMESRNPAWCDYTQGERARNALARFLASGSVLLQRTGMDHYGRTLARLTVNGQDAGRYLISRGLARPWH